MENNTTEALHTVELTKTEVEFLLGMVKGLTINPTANDAEEAFQTIRSVSKKLTTTQL